MNTSTDPEAELILHELSVLDAESTTRYGSKDLAPEHLPCFYLERLEAYAAVRKKIREQCAVMLEQIDAREKALVWRYGKQFKAAVDAELATRGGKKKSIDYPTGRAGYRMSQMKLVIEDEEAFQNWLVTNGHADCIRIKTEIDKVAAKKAVVADGELPDGADVIPAADEFFPPIPTVTFDREKEGHERITTNADVHEGRASAAAGEERAAP